MPQHDFFPGSSRSDEAQPHAASFVSSSYVWPDLGLSSGPHGATFSGMTSEQDLLVSVFGSTPMTFQTLLLQATRFIDDFLE